MNKRKKAGPSGLLGVLAALLISSGCGDATPSADEAQQTEEAPPQATFMLIPEGPQPTEEELAALRSAVEQAPDDSRARRRLAIALFGAGKAEESLALFEEDARSNPGPASLLNLGKAYSRVLRYPDAEATYRKVLELSPKHPTALHALGNLAIKRGNPDEAIDLYTQAIAAKPDYLMAYAHLADALKQGGDKQGAYNAYARAVDLKPSNLAEMELYQDSVYNLAALDLAAGEPDRAVDLLKQLLQANPDHPSAHYAFGQALLMLGQEEDAQRAFEAHMKVQASREATSPMAMGD